MALPTKEEIIRRKKVMQAAGINVPNTDESWGPWWDEQWEKATTHTKTADYYGVPSFWNFLSKTIDDVTGNTTYKAEPLPLGGTLGAVDDSAEAQIKRTLNNWQHYGDPARDAVLALMPSPSTPIKAGKAVTEAVPKMIKAVPRLFTKEGAKEAGIKTAKFVARETPKALTGYLGGKAVDAASEAFTGKPWAENAANKMSSIAGFHIEPIIGDMTNLGYGYGYFVGNNFSNLGRYTLDNLKPWGYFFDKEQMSGLGRIITQPFYKTPPTFYNHRPRWYTKRQDDSFYEGFIEPRFENGANWARIPESEVPRKYFTKNPNGTIRPTDISERIPLDKSDFKYPGENIGDRDLITPGQVGGEHSDFTYLGDDLAGNSLFEYRDRQQLNPQWQLSDWAKKKYNLQEGTKIYNLVHKLGGIDLSPVLGYKPFSIEFMYGQSPRKNTFLIEDANYLTNPIP